MRKNVLVRAPRRARANSLYGTPRENTPERHAGTDIPGGHHTALGKSALQNTLNAVGSWVDTLKFSARLPPMPNATTARSGTHGSMREGATLGLIVATSTWIWVAAVDAVVGEPFHTFTVLGGIAAFTIVHYLLNLIYGVVLVSGIRGTTREPTLMMAIVFGFLMVEFAFAFLAAVFSNLGLGDLAWLRLFVGSLVGALITVAVLARRHPLAAQLRQAK